MFRKVIHYYYQYNIFKQKLKTYVVLDRPWEALVVQAFCRDTNSLP
jgi:hypothetical protein